MKHRRRTSDHAESKGSRRRVVLVAALAATAIAAALGAAGAALWLNAGRTTDVTATTRQIQQERARNIRRACEEQNAKHDSTVDTLNRVMLERLHRPAPKSASPAQVSTRLAGVLQMAKPPVRTQIEQSIGATVLLISALAPRRNCAALVKQQVSTRG